MGSHYGRKIYAVASYQIYESQVSLLTGKFIGESAWMSSVLAHGGSIATSLSYANVKIEFGFKAEMYKLPKNHWMDLFEGRLKALEAKYEAVQETSKKNSGAFQRAS